MKQCKSSPNGYSLRNGILLSNNHSLNRLVQLTPPGRGAVATVLVEGPDVDRVAEGLLYLKSGKKLSDYPADRPIFAHFGDERGEEVVVRRCGCHWHPASEALGETSVSEDAASRESISRDASGTQSIEVHCHGGIAAVSAVENAFAAQGFAAVSWKQWIAEIEPDPITAAARIALADARTERTAAILLDQYHGALSRAFEAIERGVGYQTVENVSDLRQVGNLPHEQQIALLLELAPLGLHLTKPWRVVLIGEPNVGKSSLLNALLGYPRAIVHHTPGTTRDAVVVQTAFDGWPVELCDTAGLRTVHHGDHGNESDKIEQAGIELAMQKIAQADLLLLVFDAGKSWTTADQAFLEQYPQALVIHNKSDLPRPDDDRPEGIFVSAVTGQGVEELSRCIAQRLVPHPPPPDAAVPFTEEQIEKLKSFAIVLDS
jgi:tRNA modification GTPase